MKTSWKAVIENVALFVDSSSEDQAGVLTVAMKKVNQKAGGANWRNCFTETKKSVLTPKASAKRAKQKTPPTSSQNRMKKFR